MADEYDEDPWVGVPQIARMIGKNPEIARELCEDGKIPTAYRDGPGTHWRARASGVRQYLEARSSRVVVRRRST